MLSDEKTKEGKRVLIPPVYELYVEYMRLGSDNRTVCARKKGASLLEILVRTMPLMSGEWFTSEGEFVRSAFEAHLVSSIQKHVNA